MKKTILYSIFSLCSLAGLAQNVTGRIISNENYTSEVFKGINIIMPDLRDVKSGSKLVVSYEGEWPAEMQGAFDYAVRIWEEILPETLPINITAKIQPIRGDQSLLSKVTFDTFDFMGDGVSMYAASMPMVKSVILQEYHSNQRHRFSNEITDISDFDGEDIIIVYNENLLDQFSFSLDGNPSASKYDFVTVALRDIAIGLGFTTSFTADTDKKEFNFTNSRLTPFETHIMNAIGSSDPATAFSNATKGSLLIPLFNWFGVRFGDIMVYAPEQWSNKTSLRYFIPEENNPLSQLLSYDFGKGYIMRDFTGADWDDVFCGVLDWRRTLTTGISSGFVSKTGTTEDVIPYRGPVSLTFNNQDNAQFLRIEKDMLLSNNPEVLATERDIKRSQVATTALTDAYCKKFNHYSPDGPTNSGLSLSVMKKDGTWDCVYTTPYINNPININIEDLSLHNDESEYARGVTGGLRYRLTQCNLKIDKNPYYTYQVKYFTRDFTPEKPTIKYGKIHEPIQPQNLSPLDDEDDDYFIDVEIGIANIEGATRVIVEQWDEGEILPFQYEAEDFRNGYFIANLDREISTQLTVVSYNDNGYRKSNTITIPPIGHPTREITFKRSNNVITIDGLSKSLKESENLRCSLNNVTGAIPYTKTLPIRDGEIDITDVPQGVYVLSVFNGSNKLGYHKFLK